MGQPRVLFEPVSDVGVQTSSKAFGQREPDPAVSSLAGGGGHGGTEVSCVGKAAPAFAALLRYRRDALRMKLSILTE